jgi:hypothetical protein
MCIRINVDPTNLASSLRVVVCSNSPTAGRGRGWFEDESSASLPGDTGGADQALGVR